MRRLRTAGLALLAAGAGSSGRPAAIVLPAKTVPEERQAAADLAEIWRKGTGQDPAVRSENDAPAASESGPWFYLGETEVAKAEAPLPGRIDPDGFCVATDSGDRVALRGASPAGTALGAAWYAQHAMGVRWFWPGERGEEIPALQSWKPPHWEQVVEPGFVSRALEADKDWLRHNGLHARLPHAHNLLNIFPRELFESHPNWFPLLEGARYRPKPGGYDWQPNLALPEVSGYAAAAAGTFFDRHPEEWGFSLSENDSDRFDQSEATVRARGPLRWFRQRPDYSDLVFGFMNRVAEQVARRYPDKLLSAYAYDWCENTPSFSILPNVVPWLTADRSQYYDPAFVREDHALIERWCRSGARIVGIYEYLEGDPFLVPRQTASLTGSSIQFEYQAGARAYYAEGEPNWGLDGPKLWLAAQLLWDPHQSVERLLDDYYRNFWKEAAQPMRRFDSLCEQAWRDQPGPSWWLKYYNDESQAQLFDPAVRRRLRALIEEARAKAASPKIAARVEVVSAAFAVTERFAEFCEARQALSGAPTALPTSRRRLLLDHYRLARGEVTPAMDAAVRAGGMASVRLTPYLRNDPSARAEALLGEGGSGWTPAGLLEPDWKLLAQSGELDDRSVWWSRRIWQGRGTPAEGRTIRVVRDAGGRVSVRFERGKAEDLFQWIPARPGKRYRAEVDFRGRVSPGNETFLILSWLDLEGRYRGQETTDQLPPGDWSRGMHLLVEGQAPPTAAWVGLGLHAYNQAGHDFSEFSQPQLSVR